MALRRGPWKLIRQPDRRGEEAPLRLFHLDRDVAESRDLAAENPDVLRDLRAEWDRLNAGMVPPLWGRG
jgi:hypothetical protein